VGQWYRGGIFALMTNTEFDPLILDLGPPCMHG
jgi:hypothetical protein